MIMPLIFDSSNRIKKKKIGSCSNHSSLAELQVTVARRHWSIEMKSKLSLFELLMLMQLLASTRMKFNFILNREIIIYQTGM